MTGKNIILAFLVGFSVMWAGVMSAQAEVKYNFSSTYSGDQGKLKKNKKYRLKARKRSKVKKKKRVKVASRGYGYHGKTTVKFNRKLRPGTILISTRERRLYYVLPGKKAIKYGVGVGRKGFSWRGRQRISRKTEWPEWYPPEEMRERELKKYGRELPEKMEGGPRNPLGARALYLGNTLYRIHGTNASSTIGGAVSSGCIRMLNKEVIDLYKRVKIGTLVIVE